MVSKVEVYEKKWWEDFKGEIVGKGWLMRGRYKFRFKEKRLGNNDILRGKVHKFTCKRKRFVENGFLRV